MGNSHPSHLRKAIIDDDQETFEKFLSKNATPQTLNRPLNKRGDTALHISVRLDRYNMVRDLVEAGCDVVLENRDHDIALDLALRKILPPDGDIIPSFDQSCPYTASKERHLILDKMTRFLLSVHGRGKSVEKLILHHMKSTESIKNIIKCMRNLSSPWMVRSGGLLLQVCVWNSHNDNLIQLFHAGVPPEHFWTTPFMPHFVPNRDYKDVCCDDKLHCEFTVLSLPESSAIQSLKYALLQDWRAEWDNGDTQTPEAQYKAALIMPPEQAILFVQAAHTYHILSKIVGEVLQYIPVMCGGPDLKNSSLVPSLMYAGYMFSKEERSHLELKSHVDFTSYDEYISQPKTLKQLCRKLIRNRMNQNVYRSVQKCDSIPTLMKDFILLKDVACY